MGKLKAVDTSLKIQYTIRYGMAECECTWVLSVEWGLLYEEIFKKKLVML